MGQKVTTQVVDRSLQDKAKWDLAILICKLLHKENLIEYGLMARAILT
jgi:hypothetical protein